MAQDACPILDQQKSLGANIHLRHTKAGYRLQLAVIPDEAVLLQLLLHQTKECLCDQ
jgi:hypothetical protein